MINIEFESFFHIKNKGSLNVQTTKNNNDEKFNVTLSNFAVKEKTNSSQVTVSDSNLNTNEPTFVETILNNQDLKIQKDGFNISPFKLINSVEKKTIEKLENLNVSFSFIEFSDVLSSQNANILGKYFTVKNKSNDNLKVESPKNTFEMPFSIEDNKNLEPLFITKITNSLSPIILSTSVLIISGKLNTKLSSFIENHAEKMNIQLYNDQNKQNSLDHVKLDNKILDANPNIIKDKFVLPKTFIAQIKITKEIKNLQNISLNLPINKVVADIGNKSKTIGFTFSKSNLEDKKLNLLKNKLKIALNSVKVTAPQKINKTEKKDNIDKLVLNHTVGKITNSVQKVANLSTGNSIDKINVVHNDLSEPLATIEHEQKNPEIISNYNSVLLENKRQILNSSSNVAYHTKENDLSNDAKSNLKNPLVIDEGVKNINLKDLKTPSQINIFDKEKIAKSFETKFNNISVASSTILENSIVESLSHPNNLKLKTNTLDVVEKSVLNDSNSTNIIEHSPLVTRKFSSESDGQINNYFPLYKQSFPSKQNENIIVSPELGIKVTPNILQTNNKVGYSNINKDSILVSTDVDSKQNENIIVSPELGIKVTPNILQTNNKVGYSNINKDSILVSTDVDSKQNENIIVSPELGIKVTPNILQTNNKVGYSNINKDSILVSTDVDSKQNENIIVSPELGIKVTPNILQTNNKVGYSNINKDSILVSTDVDSKQNENIIVSPELGIKVTPNILQTNNKVGYSNINKDSILVSTDVDSKQNENIIVSPELGIKVTPNILQTNNKVGYSNINKDSILVSTDVDSKQNENIIVSPELGIKVTPNILQTNNKVGYSNINKDSILVSTDVDSKQNENIIVSPELGIKVTPNILQTNNKVGYSNINKDSILVSTDVDSKQNENIIVSPELGIKVTPNILQTNNKVGYSNINKDSILVSTDVDSKQNENIIVSPELGIKVTPNILQTNNKVGYSNINKEEKVFIFNETLRALNSYLKSNNIEIDSLNSPQIDDYKEPKLSLNTKTNIIGNNLNISSDSINTNNLENEDNSIGYLAPKIENEDNYNLPDTNLNPDNLVDANPLITTYISIINESILNKENKKTEEPKALPDLINNTIGQIDYVLVNVRDNKINKEPIELENIFKSNYKYNDVEQDIKIMPQNAFIFSSIISPLINNDKNIPKTINKDNHENKKLYNIFKEFINSEFPEVEIIEDSIEKKYFSNDLKFVKNELFSSKNEKLEKFINNISENSSGELIEEKDDDNIEIKNTNPFLSSSQIIKAINNGVAIHFSQITEVVQELASNPAKVDKNIVMNITLKPQNLGDISLTCTLTEGNKMSVIFETSTSAAQKVIESYVKNIKDIIKDNSLIVHEVSSNYSAPSSSKPISSRERGSSNNGTNNSSSESTKSYNQRRKRRRDDNDNDSSDSSLSI